MALTFRNKMRSIIKRNRGEIANIARIYNKKLLSTDIFATMQSTCHLPCASGILLHFENE